MVRNCAPENLEILGSVLAHRPGMTAVPYRPSHFGGRFSANAFGPSI
jgi:hypothetical protein